MILFCVIFVAVIFNSQSKSYSRQYQSYEQRQAKILEVVEKISSLNKTNRNAVLLLIDSLYEQEQIDFKKQFRIFEYRKEEDDGQSIS